MSAVVCSNTQEEYDDDFEKDLDWLISEDENKSEEQEPDDDDDIAQIDRLLEEDEKIVEEGVESRSKGDSDATEERWPTPMEPVPGMFVTDSNPVAMEKALPEDDDNEEKKSLLQKIKQANRQLQDQEPPDQMRRRRLQFKDKLVDLVVPAQNYSAPCRDLEVDGEVSGQMLRLKISPQEESVGRDRGQDVSDECDKGGAGQGESAREGRVLVERDGKFDLVSLKEVESLLPPLSGNYSDGRHGSSRTPSEPVKSPSLPLSPQSTSVCPGGAEPLHAPRPPPPRSRARPNSASHPQGPAGGHGADSRRRVQSASGAPALSTYTLSSQQKELLTKQQQRRQRLAREEEERRRENEEHKRQENELAFRAWLAKKRLQLQDERRVQRAQHMEMMSCKRECPGPDEAFRLWLQKKQEQQVREKQLEELKRLEQESALYLHTPEERHKAFTLWLRRKRVEKRAEQQAARERSRRLVLEERRARRTQNLLCTVNENRPFRFNDPYGHHF